MIWDAVGQFPVCAATNQTGDRGMHAVRQARSFRLIKWKAHMATWPEKLTKPSNNSGLVVSTFGRMPSSVLLDT